MAGFSKLRGRAKGRLLATSVVLMLVASSAPALSLKGVMKQMADNTSAGKTLLSSFEASSARAVLQHYVTDARSAGNLVAGTGSARAEDLRMRFEKMATFAQGASDGRLDQASFRKAFLMIAAECRSCHTSYK